MMSVDLPKGLKSSQMFAFCLVSTILTNSALFFFSQREQRKTLRELKAWADQLERDCAQAQRDGGSFGVKYQVSSVSHSVIM